MFYLTYKYRAATARIRTTAAATTDEIITGSGLNGGVAVTDHKLID